MAKSDLRTTPQQVRSAETIKGILDAAEQVFAEKGVDNATTSDIAEAAHISVGRVYYWFSSKEAIVEALGDRSTDLIEAFYASVIATRDQFPRFTSTERILRGIVQLARDNPSLALVLVGRSRAMSANLKSMRDKIVEGSTATYAAQFPGTSWAEARLVAETSFSIAYGALPQMISEDGDDLLREVVYATSAYLCCRFPSEDWPVSEYLAPARSVDYGGVAPHEPIRPVTFPQDGSTT